jgi:hypothetical protein
MFYVKLQKKLKVSKRDIGLEILEGVREIKAHKAGKKKLRTPAGPIEVYEQKLKDLGKPIEVHWFEAGHLGARVEQDIQNREIMLRFAFRVIG